MVGVEVEVDLVLAGRIAGVVIDVHEVSYASVFCFGANEEHFSSPTEGHSLFGDKPINPG